VEDQGRAGAIGALPAGGDAGAAGLGLADDRLEAQVRQERGDVLGRGPLAGAVGVAVVRGVDPDQIAGQGDDVGLGHALQASGHTQVR